MIIEAVRLNWMKKIRGLIGVQNIKPLYFQTRFGIHTFGVKRPIDVVILNKQNNVVKLKANLQPNRIFLWNLKYEHVLELPANTIEKMKIKKGEIVTLKFI